MCPSYMPVPGGFIGQSYTATANGQYAVIVSQNGCADTSACYQVTGIGLNEYEDGNYFKVSPNPSKGLLCIRVADELKNATITIMNSMGETVFSKPHVDGKQLDIDLSNQVRGFYLLEIQMQDIVHRTKVMKE